LRKKFVGEGGLIKENPSEKAFDMRMNGRKRRVPEEKEAFASLKGETEYSQGGASA